MRIGANSDDVMMTVEVFEGEHLNREASRFIEDNYNKLVHYIIGRGVVSRAEDLLHDVYISCLKHENDGEGYDSSKGITVAQMVYNKIKKYCENKRYRSDISEVQCVNVNGNKIVVSTICASGTDDNSDDADSNMTSIQRAYMNAADIDNLEDAEDAADLKEDIDFCIDIAGVRGVDILSVLKNISKLATLCVGASNVYSVSGIDKLCKLGEEHDEFLSTFSSIVKFSGKNPELYNKVIASY